MVPFPPTFVINIKENRNRLKYIKQEFSSWPVKVERINAVKMNPGWKGCTMSHRKIIQKAQDNNYPWVLCLEDDCKLKKDAIERFQKILDFLWSNKDWDLFNGGIYNVRQYGRKEPKVINSDLSIIEIGGTATNFVLIPKRSYSKILKDLDPHDPTQVIDVYYPLVFPNFWVTYPPLATQLPSYSNIEKKNTNYKNFMVKTNKTLKNILKKSKTRKIKR